jgi:ParB family chromosome partitioning protein
MLTEGEHDQATLTAEPDATPEPEGDEGLKPIPDRLMTELTAHRTLALRHALGEHPEVAFTATLHALCLKAFYRYAQDGIVTSSKKRLYRRVLPTS